MDIQVDAHEVEAYLRRLCRKYYVYAHVEPTNACNADCAICPREAMVRKLQMMTWSTFVNIMQTILPTPIPMLALVGFGEPTLHRQIIDMIAYARDRRPDLAIKITTNGSKITDENLDRFFNAGLDLLEISVFGHSPATYEEQMEGLKFRDIERLITALNKAGHPYSLSTVQSDGTSVDEINGFWASLGVGHLAIKGLHRRGGYLDLENSISGTQALGNYRVRSDAFSDAMAVDSCHKLYMFLHVNAAGQILPCVQEINAENILGRVSGESTIDTVVELTRSHRPVFNICAGCELKQQDLMQYYANFFATRFPERVQVWQARLAAAD